MSRDELVLRRSDGSFLVLVECALPPEETGTPTLRYAVLPLERGKQARYVIYDRRLSRIVDGVYLVRSMALDAAASYNHAGCPGDRAPNAAALGLLWPAVKAHAPCEPGKAV